MENVCKVFIDGIQHPNERTLAEELVLGKEISLDWDESQIEE